MQKSLAETFSGIEERGTDIPKEEWKHHANDEHVCILERASAVSMVLAEWQTDWANDG